MEPREGGAPGNSNGRGGSKEAAEATRDGGGDVRYVSPAWAGRRGLGPGGVMCQCPIRAPGIVPEACGDTAKGGSRRSAHLALPSHSARISTLGLRPDFGT